MDKNVVKISTSIIITLILVMVSIPLWNYSSGKQNSILADSSEALNISVIVGDFPKMLIIEDERAFDNIEPTTISLRNRNSFNKDCALLMLVSKESTLNYKNIKIAIEDKTYNLKDLIAEEDKENYYFYLNKYKIEKYSNIEIRVRMWLDENTKLPSGTPKLITNFVTK